MIAVLGWINVADTLHAHAAWPTRSIKPRRGQERSSESYARPLSALGSQVSGRAVTLLALAASCQTLQQWGNLGQSLSAGLTKMISKLSKEGAFRKGLEVFHALPELGITYDTTITNAAISACDKGARLLFHAAYQLAHTCIKQRFLIDWMSCREPMASSPGDLPVHARLGACR